MTKTLKAVLTFVMVMFIVTIAAADWIPYYETFYPEIDDLSRIAKDVKHLLANEQEADEAYFVYSEKTITYSPAKKKDDIDLIRATYHLADNNLVTYYHYSPFGYILYHLAYVSEVDNDEYYLDDGNNILNIVSTFRPYYPGKIRYSLYRNDDNDTVISEDVVVMTIDDIPMPSKNSYIIVSLHDEIDETFMNLVFIYNEVADNYGLFTTETYKWKYQR